jgi:hypothetical protein
VRSWARPHADERWSRSTRVARRSTTHGSAADDDCEDTQVRPKPYSSLWSLFFFFDPSHGWAG